ncbi:hypothetical protein GCM10027034_40670 [Ramlibacter solisilvae]|nr:type II secretion system minor pseudopilin GspK [Ramlibacter tataouinensis]
MKRTQAGAALLMAMLTVALVATFAAAALWQQWRSVEVETAERARIQASWILTGSLDWARLVLREDARSGNVDHLGEPWAVPLEEARLSSFLSADQGVSNADIGPGVMDAFLSGTVTDLQSHLNVNDLVESTGTPREASHTIFARLFAILNLPQSELDKLAENLRFAVVAASTSPGAAQAPLLPQGVAQLAWLGVSPDTVAALSPFVTILNTTQPTPVNLNTAPAEVIAAAAGVPLAQAQQLVRERDGAHLKNSAEAQRVLGTLTPDRLQALGVSSSFFEVRARLRLDQLVVEERAVLQRVNRNDVRVIQRERVVVDPNAPAQLAAARR